jgi:hypothetical protein
LAFVSCAAIAIAAPKAAWAQGNVDSLDSVPKYALGCYKKLGLSPAQIATLTPSKFDCLSPNAKLLPTELDGVKLDGMVSAFPDQCDNPAWLSQKCYGNSTIQQLPTGNPNVSAVMLCRHKSVWTDDPKKFDDIAIIMHDKGSGNTCWFQALDPGASLDGNNVTPPSLEQEPPKFWMTPQDTAFIRCDQCHDNGAFMHSPWINKSGVVPRKRLGKYNTPGKAFSDAGWQSGKFVSVGNRGLPVRNWQKCTSCHEMSATLYKAPMGMPPTSEEKNGTRGRWMEWTTGAPGKFSSHTSATGQSWRLAGWMPTMCKSGVCYPSEIQESSRAAFDNVYATYLTNLGACQDAGGVGLGAGCDVVVAQTLPGSSGPLVASMTASVPNANATLTRTATETNNPAFDWQWGTLGAQMSDTVSFEWLATGAMYCVVEATFPDGVVSNGVATASNWTTASGKVDVGPFTVAGSYVFDISCDGMPKEGDTYVDPPMASARVAVVVGAAGQSCSDASNCVSGVCTDGVCQATCTDGLRDGSETGVDCGGGSCPACGPGEGCASASDCVSGACTNSVCQATCSDGLLDGSETGLDCGGGTCSACGDGLGCISASDCQNGVCRNAICLAAACANGMQDGSETAVDCGGACAPCAAGLGCNAASDCVSGVCSGGACQATCNDRVRDGNETDVDCGGGGCSACAEERSCNVASDCASNVCTSGVCQATCNDGIVDGHETGVDCGGRCAKCDAGQPCFGPADCKSYLCMNGVCAPTYLGGGSSSNGAGGGGDDSAGNPAQGSGGGGGVASPVQKTAGKDQPSARPSSGCTSSGSGSSGFDAAWLGLGLLVALRRGRRKERAERASGFIDDRRADPRAPMPTR